jgi:hypothetical protein
MDEHALCSRLKHTYLGLASKEHNHGPAEGQGCFVVRG